MLDDLELEVHNAHLPPGSTRGVIKPQAFRAIRQRTDQALGPHVLCGDFNTPKHENATSFETWAPSDPRSGADWDAAERGVLENSNLRDVYRERHHASDPFAVSHYTGTTARRYDHIYASTDLRATDAPTTRRGWRSSATTPQSRRTSRHELAHVATDPDGSSKCPRAA